MCRNGQYTTGRPFTDIMDRLIRHSVGVASQLKIDATKTVALCCNVLMGLYASL
jgi:hypothetical protein